MMFYKCINKCSAMFPFVYIGCVLLLVFMLFYFYKRADTANTNSFECQDEVNPYTVRLNNGTLIKCPINSQPQTLYVGGDMVLFCKCIPLNSKKEPVKKE